jgi:hypothetical protein
LKSRTIQHSFLTKPTYLKMIYHYAHSSFDLLINAVQKLNNRLYHWLSVDECHGIFFFQNDLSAIDC